MNKIKPSSRLTKPRKLPSLPRLRRKADKLWSIAVRSRVAHCEGCNRFDHLQAHHIISRRFGALRWSLDNGLCLCPTCHKLSPSHSAHGNPFWVLRLCGEQRVARLDLAASTGDACVSKDRAYYEKLISELEGDTSQ